MPVKKLYKKKIGNITYELRFFEGDHKYVIYKWDKEIMKDGKVHEIPEVGIFNNEEDARKYLEKLK